ncbi:MAG: 2-oxo acid dehydrogenase subunit E2 [Elusimicrobia bacterium]|nr:2-oxo acid dehydrogenase subunit E2 [Elusimicrobiota bacterium]
MAYEFKLPDVGEGLHEGEVVQWYVKEGDAVKAEQHLVDILTEKATVEITCPKDGAVLKILVKPGEKITVGQTIVVFGQAGEIYDESPRSTVQRPTSSESETNGHGSIEVAQAASAPGEVSATPAVRKLAKDLGIDLAKVRGTGPNGRIVEEDIRSFSFVPTPSAQHLAPSSFGPEERVPFSGIRRKTAEKMALSYRNVAHVTHVDEADVTELIALREQAKARALGAGVKLTYMAYIIKATALTLKEHPYLNAALDEARQEIVLKRYFNISIAMDTEKGLVTPVVREADQKSVIQIARELEALVHKARAGQLAASDFQGGTFTITNIGPIGGVAATPIVNYPDVAILGVMKMVKRPAVKNGQIVIRDMMNLCLSFDHRVLDGAEAARFVGDVIKKIENPTIF